MTASKQTSSTNLASTSGNNGSGGGGGPNSVTNSSSATNVATSTNNSQANMNNKLNMIIDESNHVSYAFEFFLHGSSRVCTSVEMGMHAPIRVVNQLDLIKMRACLKKHFLYATRKKRKCNKQQRSKQRRESLQATSNQSTNPNSTQKSEPKLTSKKLPQFFPSLILFDIYKNTIIENSISGVSAKKRSQRRKRHGKRFMGLKVILAPYGIAGRLLGYLANDSVESRVTCDEWRQFYPLKLLPNMPNVFCVGIDHNRIKLFYPNCFVYVVMDR